MKANLVDFGAILLDKEVQSNTKVLNGGLVLFQFHKFAFFDDMFDLVVTKLCDLRACLSL